MSKTLYFTHNNRSNHLVSSKRMDHLDENSQQLLNQAHTLLYLDQDKTWLVSDSKGLSLYQDDGDQLSLQASYEEDGFHTSDLSLDLNRRLIISCQPETARLRLYTIEGDGEISLGDDLALRGRDRENDTIAARPTSCQFSPDGNWLIVTDSATDTLYTFEIVKNTLLREVERLQVGEEFGLKQVCFHPQLDIAYALSEYKAELVTMEYDPSAGKFTPFLTMSTLPEHVVDVEVSDDHHQTTQLILDDKGDYLYVLNQKIPSLVTFSIHPRAGASQLLDFYHLEDWTADQIAFSPKEDCIHAISSQSGQAMTFKRSKNTGKLEKEGLEYLDLRLKVKIAD